MKFDILAVRPSKQSFQNNQVIRAIHVQPNHDSFDLQYIISDF